MAGLEVRSLTVAERPWLAQELTRLWGSSVVVSRGRARDAAELPALVCIRSGEAAGIATFEVQGEACEVVTLDAFRPRQGIGTLLLDGVATEARRRGCRRLWLITTNDKLGALRFYQRRGLRVVAVHVGAVDAARALKPSIPTVGEFGIAIHDELEFALDLI